MEHQSVTEIREFYLSGSSWSHLGSYGRVVAAWHHCNGGINALRPHRPCWLSDEVTSVEESYLALEAFSRSLTSMLDALSQGLVEDKD